MLGSKPTDTPTEQNHKLGYIEDTIEDTGDFKGLLGTHIFISY